MTGVTLLIHRVAQLNECRLLLIITDTKSTDVSKDNSPDGFGLDDVVEESGDVKNTRPGVDDCGGDEPLLVLKRRGLQASLELASEVRGEDATDNGSTVVGAEVPIAEMGEGSAGGSDVYNLMGVRGDIIKIIEKSGENI